MRRRPKCYAGCGKPARKGYRFCTQRCASEYAEELVSGNDDTWCPHCEAWVSVHDEHPGCGHVIEEHERLAAEY